MDLAWILARAPALGLVWARIGGMVALTPVLGSAQVPWGVRGALALVLSLLVLPAVEPPPSLPAPAYLVALAAEAATGAAVGLLAHLLVMAAQGAGELLDLDVGLSVGQVLAPELGMPGGGLLAGLAQMLALWVFLAADGHLAVLRALLDSFAAMPPGWPALPPQRALELAQALGWVVVTALKLAAPLLAFLMLVTVAVAVAGRLLPQMNVFFAALPVKTALGLAGLALLMPLWVEALAQQAMPSLEPLLRWLGGRVP